VPQRAVAVRGQYRHLGEQRGCSAGGHAHLVGHDWGAAIAWMTAAVAGERVSSVTALSVAGLLSISDTR
jgi:pimeloyl-ACP methyl ester carboxylesterase